MGNNGNMRDFIFLGSKITADGDYSQEMKRHLILGRKAMTNIDSVLKSRGITSLTKVRTVKTMFLPVITCGCESRTIKKAEHWRIDAFELWGWRRLLRVPWTARISNQSTLKENQSWIFIGKTEAEAETPTLWSPAKNWLIGKDPDAGKDWRQEEKGMTGWDGWMTSLTQWTWVWASSNSWWWTGKPDVLQSMGSQRVRHDWATELKKWVLDIETISGLSRKEYPNRLAKPIIDKGICYSCSK